MKCLNSKTPDGNKGAKKAAAATKKKATKTKAEK